MAVAEQTTHIHRDPQGWAWIDDTNIKVIEVVQDYLAYGWSPEEMHLQHPHLSLAQIHAALSFYYDHRSSTCKFRRVLKELAPLLLSRKTHPCARN